MHHIEDAINDQTSVRMSNSGYHDQYVGMKGKSPNKCSHLTGGLVLWAGQ